MNHALGLQTFTFSFVTMSITNWNRILHVSYIKYKFCGKMILGAKAPT